MQPPSFTPDTVTLWFHYEELAMHFNSLIIQFRLQLIGGIGALGTAAAYFIGGKVEDASQRAWLRTIIAGGLLVLTTAAAMLDLLYYDQLLRGAVKAIVAYEAAHPEIQISTTIATNIGWFGDHVMWFAYSLMLLALSLFAGWSWTDYKRTSTPAAAAPSARAGAEAQG